MLMAPFPRFQQFFWCCSTFRPSWWTIMDMPVLVGGMLDLHRHIDDKVCVNLHLHNYWDPEFPSTILLYSEIVF